MGHIIFLLVCISWTIHAERSIHRPENLYTPYIITNWQEQPEHTSHLVHKHLRYWPIFTRFDYEHFMYHQLPKTNIPYRYDASSYVSGQELDQSLQDFIKKLTGTKRRFSEISDFIVLKDRDYNYKHHSGVLILKSKYHPFIVKLFMEKPHTITKPFSKGIEPCFFFSMTGGMSRFFAGFTRIKNKLCIEHIIAQSNEWSHRVTLPRKWFWTPHDVSWIDIHGYHLGGNNTKHHISVPSTYAVISDAIDTEKTSSMLTSHNRKIALDLTQYVGNNRLDPHIDNFMIEKDTNKIAIIDTEHFASMTGIQEPMQFSSYKSWYIKLSRKCIKDMFLQSKRDRISRQTTHVPSPLIVEGEA